MTVLFYLIASHFVCDYPLQSDFIAIGKNPEKGIYNGVPWYWIMAGHSFTHGAGVALATNNVWLGIIETVCHFFIDVAKCVRLTTINEDQLAHIGCKLAWFGIYMLTN